MPTSINKALVYRLIEEGWNRGDGDVVAQITAPSALTHLPGETAPSIGPAGAKQILLMSRAGIPDLCVTVDDLMAEDNTVVVRWTARGTQRGELLGIPPTGRPVTVTGIHIFRFHNAKIVESWVQFDALGLLHQLSALPEPTQATA